MVSLSETTNTASIRMGPYYSIVQRCTQFSLQPGVSLVLEIIQQSRSGTVEGVITHSSSRKEVLGQVRYLRIGSGRAQNRFSVWDFEFFSHPHILSASWRRASVEKPWVVTGHRSSTSPLVLAQLHLDHCSCCCRDVAYASLYLFAYRISGTRSHLRNRVFLAVK
jgi:hypothetical protein